MKTELIKFFSNNTALPVLFIGSGISRRYLNLPDWEGLLKMFCKFKPYEYYYSKSLKKCREERDMILPTVASYIEEEFNDHWYIDSEYKQSREEHKEEMEKKISPFKICIAEYFRKISEKTVEIYNDEIDLLKKIGNKNISCIITTNYDCFLEQCFGRTQFRTYIGQNDLIFSTTYEIGELYKIHGCCTQSESIIIDADDYIDFAKKSIYLSSKILTIFLERPIIFLGYSINDSNIMRILDSIADCLDNNNLEKLSERLLFVEWNKNPEQCDNISYRTITTKNGKNIGMKNISLYDYTFLYKSILENKAKYDVKILRRLKSQLYELVEQNQPTEKLYIATDIEDEKVDFVVGVGVYSTFGRVGYRGIRAEEIFLHALGRSELRYDGKMILKEAIPSLFNIRIKLPVCQYIVKYADKECLNREVRLSFRESFEDLLAPGEKDKISKNGNSTINYTLQEFYREHGLSKTLSIIPLLSPEKIDIEDLSLFINKALDDEPMLLATNGHGHQSRSNFKKCIAF